MPSFLFLAAGSVLLYGGAEILVRGASALALRLGLTPLVIGLTVVAFGTSSPELVVSVQAALAGSAGLALGNVIGSNIANIALILGISALIRPMTVESQLVRQDVPLVVLSSLLLVSLLLDGVVSRWEGGLFVAGLTGYITFNVIQARRTKTTVTEDEVPGTAERAVWLDLVMVLGGIGVLVLGSTLFVNGAVDLATRLGLSEVAIGLTIVAVGTSLPELATSVVASVRGSGDVSVGNVIGSNLFNVLGILGLTALVQPLAAGGISVVDLTVFVAVAFLVLPLLRSGFVLQRWEGGVLLVCYVAYTAYLLALAG